MRHILKAVALAIAAAAMFTGGAAVAAASPDIYNDTGKPAQFALYHDTKAPNSTDLYHDTSTK